MWRRKLTIPEGIRAANRDSIARAEALLTHDKVVYVDESVLFLSLKRSHSLHTQCTSSGAAAAASAGGEEEARLLAAFALFVMIRDTLLLGRSSIKPISLVVPIYRYIVGVQPYIYVAP